MRRLLPVIAVVSALLLATGCAPARGAPGDERLTSTPAPTSAPPQTLDLRAGSHAYAMDSGGLVRTFRVYVPRDLAGAAPLVVMLHGGGGSGAQAERAYGWDRQAEAGGFIVAYPDGLGRPIPAWNVDATGDGCCGYPAREGIDDVAFVRGLVASLDATGFVDPARIYATGMSNGGIMAYTLACETDLFAAVAPVAATMLTACADPRPVSVLHIHGLRDENIRFDGGPGAGIGRIDGPPVPDVIEYWREVDACAAPEVTTDGVVSTQASGCADGRSVELITVADGAHGWPGAQKAHGAGPDDIPSQALDATAAIWGFFAAHPEA